MRIWSKIRFLCRNTRNGVRFITKVLIFMQISKYDNLGQKLSFGGILRILPHFSPNCSFLINLSFVRLNPQKIIRALYIPVQCVFLQKPKLVAKSEANSHFGDSKGYRYRNILQFATKVLSFAICSFSGFCETYAIFE